MGIIVNNYINSLIGKRVAVIGAGISNTPLIDLLLEAGVDTTVCDKSSREKLGEAAENFRRKGAKLKLGEGYLNELDGDVIFRTPGLMPTSPAIRDAVARGAVLTSEMEVFFDICPCKIIAITGSDGKTTTTSIIADILKNEGKTVHVGGNIGTPLLSRADEIQPDDIAVIELSSFQLITMKKSPDIAVVTNLSPNHLDIHKDMEEYVEAKRNIYKHQKLRDRVVFNFDNGITREYAKNAPADDILFFSKNKKVKNGVYLYNGTVYESTDWGATAIMQAEDIILPGEHNIENYLAACAAVKGIAGYDSIRKTAKSFSGVEHRLEFVRELRGVKYYNDSIASSPSRAIAGIKALTTYSRGSGSDNRNGNLILIAGGKDKGVAFDELATEIVDRVKTLVLTGAAAHLILIAVENVLDNEPADHPKALEIIQSGCFEDAVVKASKAAKEGDIVLLSPACTSFDSFKNFVERGNTFKSIVSKLI